MRMLCDRQIPTKMKGMNSCKTSYVVWERMS